MLRIRKWSFFLFRVSVLFDERDCLRFCDTFLRSSYFNLLNYRFAIFHEDECSQTFFSSIVSLVECTIKLETQNLQLTNPLRYFLEEFVLIVSLSQRSFKCINLVRQNACKRLLFVVCDYVSVAINKMLITNNNHKA